MSQWKPDLGEFLYKHPQLKNSLLNQTIVLMNTKFAFKKETEGFEVICVMPFPGVSQREEEVYLIVLRFPLEMDVNKLQQALENSCISFQVIGLGKSSNLLPGKKYRPLSVIWVDTGKNLEEDDRVTYLTPPILLINKNSALLVVTKNLDNTF